MTLEGANRRILFAFLLSLALHSVLLWMFPVFRSAPYQRGNTTAPLDVRLVEPLPRPLANQVFLTAPTEPKPAAAAQSVPKRQLQTTRKPDVTLEPQVVAKSAPLAATIEPAQTLDAGTLAQYRLSVLGAARRFKSYPDVAIENSWQGKAEVRMVIDSTGEISGLEVRTSAGHAVLDQHALYIVGRAKAVAPIPPALRGRGFIVDVPVVFSLGSGA